VILGLARSDSFGYDVNPPLSIVDQFRAWTSTLMFS
jgi:hypothetical protein